MSTLDNDRPLLGIGLMLGFCLLAPFADALAKLLGPEMAVGQLVTLRFAFQAAILVPLTLATGRVWRMDRRTFGYVFLRTLLHISGIGLMFSALLYLPLADAVAIAFVMPFIMLLLGYWFLGEEVGLRRITACAVGFVGTLLVVQPAFTEVGWPALLPLGVALVFALFMLVTRRIAGVTDPIGMQAVSAVIALALLLPVMALTPAERLPALEWTAPNGRGWTLITLMGIAGTFAHLLMTWSLRYAPASTLAPMQYLEIPFATAVGFAIFGDLPGPLASLGIAVTIGSGLYIVMRERAMQKARPPAPQAVHSGTPPAG
ncbi:DMT family transporter [Mameliella sediminis]|uniref:DMT family transporter n=1 Tax=Mameliella sediminis TaxID=2836866 RepID=UPI001C46D824|nr:DMT family transporter [Mameliella sediminis]MBY6117257.1 DMT family transporter [Antarctobacter heliothermus]MBY6147113.1 DMT family transporter [Mameliella alba]MBV7397100.1 DMT family transporter [Mameliella sediminis]MBY6161969.1 DMT family transporter [Mameliella alba]MBY6170439.1 DMT family transporter [Mameliella alba]